MVHRGLFWYEQWSDGLYKPRRAPSPALQPAARWAHARRTPPSSPWGSWCRWSTPWPGTALHSRTSSLWGAHAESRSDSIKLCRERMTTEFEMWVYGLWDHHRLTIRLAPGLKAEHFCVTATATVWLTCYNGLLSTSWVAFKASAVHSDLHHGGCFTREEGNQSCACGVSALLNLLSLRPFRCYSTSAASTKLIKVSKDPAASTDTRWLSVWLWNDRGMIAPRTHGNTTASERRLSLPFVWLQVNRYPTPSPPFRYVTHLRLSIRVGSPVTELKQL